MLVLGAVAVFLMSKNLGGFNYSPQASQNPPMQFVIGLRWLCAKNGIVTEILAKRNRNTFEIGNGNEWSFPLTELEYERKYMEERK
jgi:hypothetical protein